MVVLYYSAKVVKPDETRKLRMSVIEYVYGTYYTLITMQVMNPGTYRGRAESRAYKTITTN